METEEKVILKKAFYAKSNEEIKEELDSNLEIGLNDDEVKARQEKDGFNELEEGKKKPIFIKFLEQFKDFMVIVLIGAAILSLVLAIIDQINYGHGDFIDPILIIAIVIINAILGVAQEAKAEKAIDSIKKLSSPHAKVIRNGKDIVIDVKDIVIGDIVVLEAGDYVPADLRIIESHNLKIEEAALTGEAVPVDKISLPLEDKEIPLGDRINLGFMSTVVTYGRGKGIVTSIGMDTEIGKIATMLQTTENDSTPLQKNISKLGKTLAFLCLFIVIVIFIIRLIAAGIVDGWVNINQETWLGAIMTSVSLAVAAIPEGLPAIITIVLAIGMQNLVKKKAIVRTLPAVETLGSTSVICSDKTGTLTQNLMTVEQLYVDGTIYKVKEIDKHSDNINKLTLYGVLCNDTKVNKENDVYLKIGDPTEIAFIDLAIALKENPIKLFADNKRIFELPFDSERKLMTTVHEFNGKRYAIIKGAPDVMFKRATSFDNDGKIIKTANFESFENANNMMADDAMRVLAVGYKELDDAIALDKLDQDTLEHDITLLGLVGMIDPARPEVFDAVKLCKKAGITTIMITGDHKNTAVAIARQLGILNENDLAITGAELDKMSDADFNEKLSSIKVYARVSPENKVRIVEAWRKTEVIVAMTGDGVNDAPSIKKADIGIAMGITGTEVAKGAADMILTDDNFATIVGAVEEGRTIFSNIKKAIQFLLSCNIGEILTILIGTILAISLWQYPNLNILTSVQLLWVNLVTDSLMGIALGMDPKEDDVMDQKPRDTRKSIFAGGMGKNIIWQGIMMGLISISTYIIGYYYSLNIHHVTEIQAHGEAQVMTFMVLALTQLFHAFNLRSQTASIFSIKPNKMLVGAFVISFALQLAVVLVPGIQNAFVAEGTGHNGLAMPDGLEWLIIAGMSIVPVVVLEIVKIFRRRNLKRNTL
ncbi:calcium-translocating P-type ATPase, PMCA-type [Acholeplasma sp. OttesenSCG-928-E16]|nr:calcium-translocating P-type ATPase, PMCA-type [Acholeplasma sp. OttesenSCG-928-E16]